MLSVYCINFSTVAGEAGGMEEGPGTVPNTAALSVCNYSAVYRRSF